MPSTYRRIDHANRLADGLLRRLGEEVRIARMSAGLSLRELAARSDCSRSHLSRIERGDATEASLRTLTVVFAVLGMQLSARPFPDGTPLRDAGQARLLSRFRARLHPAVRMLTEVLLRGDRERRAWDGELVVANETCKLEAETVLYDLQALDRRIARKMADDGVDRLILLVADTRRNRQVLREFHALVSERYPLATRAVLAPLGKGQLPHASGCVIM